MKKIIILLALILNLAPFFNNKGSLTCPGELIAQTNGDEGSSSSGGYNNGSVFYGSYSDGPLITVLPPDADPQTGTAILQTSAPLSDGSSVTMHSIDPMPLNQIPNNITNSSGLAPSSISYSGGEAQSTCGGYPSGGGDFDMILSMYSSACVSTYSSSSDFINSFENTLAQNFPDPSNSIISIGAIDNTRSLVTIATNDAPNGGWQISQAITVSIPPSLIVPPKSIPVTNCGLRPIPDPVNYTRTQLVADFNNIKANAAAHTNEKSFPIYLKNDGGYYGGNYTYGTAHSVAMDYHNSTDPLTGEVEQNTGVAHLHPSTTSFSAGDLYGLGDGNKNNPSFTKLYVVNSAGEEYAMEVTDPAALATFMNNYSYTNNFDPNTNMFKDGTDLSLDYRNAYDNLATKNYTQGDAMALAMAFTLTKNKAGVTMLKNEGNGFRELKANEIVDGPIVTYNGTICQ